jgi:hypothetical protein
MTLRRMPGDLGVVLGRPVTEISKPLAAAGTDDQQRGAGDNTIRFIPCRRRDRDVPDQIALADPQRLTETEKPLGDMAGWRRRNAVVDEKAMPIPCPAAIKPDA